MISPIYKLFMDYKDKDINEDYINAVFETLMGNEQLDDFITNFDLFDEDSGRLAVYNVDEKRIRVNRVNAFNPEYDAAIPRNMLIMRAIRHEIEHARNYQIVSQGGDDIESATLKIAMKDYAVQKGFAYYDLFDITPYTELEFRFKKKENYITDPDERLADIRAWQFLVNMLKNQRTSWDLLVARNMLYRAYIRGYQNKYYLDAPTYQFMLKMGMYHEYYLFKKRVEERSKEYSFETRLTYGLPLKGDEYPKKILRKVRLSENANRRIQR